jgi:copper homeostasis protein
MAGSGVRSNTIADLVNTSHAKEYHTTAKAYIDSHMQYRNPNVSMGGIPGVPEYGIAVSQAEQVKLIRTTAENVLNAS